MSYSYGLRLTTLSAYRPWPSGGVVELSWGKGSSKACWASWQGCAFHIYRGKGGDEKEKRSGSLTRLRDDKCLRPLCYGNQVVFGERRGSRGRPAVAREREPIAVVGVSCQRVLRQVLLSSFFNFCFLILIIFLTFLLSSLFCKVSYNVEFSFLSFLICFLSC